MTQVSQSWLPSRVVVWIQFEPIGGVTDMAYRLVPMFGMTMSPLASL